MKSYKELTGKYLRTQKRRATLAIIGIILSVALISAIGTMLVSFRQVLIDETIEDRGNWHVNFIGVDAHKVSLLKNNVNIEDAAITSQIGVAPIAETIDREMDTDDQATSSKGGTVILDGATQVDISKRQETPPYTYLVIEGYDNKALEMLPVNVKEGRLPSSPGEIAIDYWALELMSGEPKLGDKVMLDVGVRKGKVEVRSDSEDVEAGEENWESITVLSDMHLEADETFESQGTREYTIVGLIQPRFEWSPNYFPSAIEYLDNKSLPIEREYTVHSTMKTVKGVHEKSETIAKDAGLEKIDTGEGPRYPIEYHNRLLSLYSESSMTHLNSSLQAILLFIIGIIVIATIAVIYNAFNISVLERISQFGIIRSVGASPKQIKGMVIREAFILSAIGIPLGLFCGVFAMQVVVFFVKRMGVDFFDSLNIIIDPITLLVSAVIGLITVYLSALGPSKRAAKVSPLEAVRNTGDYKTESFKRVKRGRLAGLVFGTEGQIAYKNLSRNKKRFNITVFSMSMSIVLFIVFSSFSSFMFKVSSTTLQDGADFTLYNSGMSPDEIPLTETHYRELKEFEQVDRVYRTGQVSMLTIIPEEKINPKFDEVTKNIWRDPDEEDSSKRKIYNNSLIKLGNENLDMLKPFLIDGKIDSETLNSENGVILIRDANVYNEDSRRYSLMPVANLKVGDTIDISSDYFERDDDYTTETFSIVGIIEKGILDFEYNLNGGLYLITSDELFDEHNMDRSSFNSFRWEITLKSGGDKEPVLKYIKDLVENNMGIGYRDLEAEVQEYRKIVLIMNIFLYGFVSVITLISSLNIINTISTNLLLRTRELAMFKAVGMSQRGVKRMVTLEGLFYGLTAAIYGGVAGAGLSYLLYRLVTDVQEFDWQMPWGYILLASVGATLVALLSGYIPLRKMNRHIIVEDIRAVD